MFTRTLGAAAALVASAALLAGCGASSGPVADAASHSPIRLVDDTHHTVVLNSPATRIVTLEPSNVEIALDLGLKNHIAGIDTSTMAYTPSPWKAQLKGLKNIGPSYPGISVEKVVAAKPDLVITGPGVKGIAQLAKFHIPVLTLNPQSAAGVYHDILLVGKATGRTEKARALVLRIKKQLRAVASEVSALPRPTVFTDLGGLYTVGPHTFLNSLIAMAGARNVGVEMSRQQWPKATAEQVVAANPSVILIDGGGTSVAQEEHIAGFSSTRAVETGHVYEVPQPSYIDTPSPAMVMGLKELVRLLHPHLAGK